MYISWRKFGIDNHNNKVIEIFVTIGKLFNKVVQLKIWIKSDKFI